MKLECNPILLALVFGVLVNEMMRVFLHTHRALMAIPMRLRSFVSPTSALKWEAGVSMVQGASRGIGLEFVSRLLSSHT